MYLFARLSLPSDFAIFAISSENIKLENLKNDSSVKGPSVFNNPYSIWLLVETLSECSPSQTVLTEKENKKNHCKTNSLLAFLFLTCKIPAYDFILKIAINYCLLKQPELKIILLLGNFHLGCPAITQATEKRSNKYWEMCYKKTWFFFSFLFT